ncbi:hypothetical protein [Novosphingobium colocasiae]|uniref:Tetratricopeptide repeat protein n=1 Tax=Novosphingobium colocasiae TaxID=1256513 RepID=A0A918PKM3_9SPHN|nr:hypothetical protein [Novosphingobium colocasiae]GGZ11965.1 hypothetical protein GCM10011614_28720 [Novosphingobium colocasiae]
MKNWRILAAAAGLLGAMAAPQAQAKSITYKSQVSPKYPAVSSGGSVAIVNFNGKDGTDFAMALASALQTAELDGRPVFNVRTEDSISYKSSAAISKTEVSATVATGRRLGAATVFTGTITAASTTVTNFTRPKEVCTKQSSPFKCETKSTVNEPCTKVIGLYSVTPRAIQVSTGAMLFSETVRTSGEYTVCSGELQSTGGGALGDALKNLFGGSGAAAKADDAVTVKVASPDALLEAMRLNAASRIRTLVAPYNREVKVDLKDRTSGLSKEDSVQFGNAVAFANAGRMDRACSIFQTIYMNDPANQSNVPLLYDMGVCQEVMLPDEPSAALQYYSRADQLLSRPDKQVSDAFLRLQNQVQQSQTITRSLGNRN